MIAAEYGYKVKGKAARETGSLLTVALRRGATGRRITGWTWSKG